MATPTSETEPADRPVPELPPENSGLATAPSDKTLDTDSDSDGRGHVPSSVPRTKFTPETPATERVAMRQLQQKINFSDQSAPSSSPSTPEHQSKKSPGETDGSASLSRPSEETAAVFAPVGAGSGGDISDYSSEGEITSSVSISAILSKLDTVKSYLKEAESLRKQLQEKMGEPGILTQLGKINKMIVELRQQESSYLNIILVIMGKDKEGNASSVPVGESLTNDESEREFSEEESTASGEAGDVGQAAGLYQEEKGDDGNGNLSLRAQLMQERQQREQEEEELRILQQKHDMLKKMLEQQRQIQELEAQQEALLQMRLQTQDQLSNAEARSLELEAMVSSVSGDGVPPANAARSATIKPTDHHQQHTQAQPEDCVKEQQVLARLVDLNARKARVEEMILLLSALKDKEGGDNVAGQSEVGSREHERRVQPPSVPTVPPQAAQDLAGSGELVDDSVPGASELQEKMRQAEEARKKLSELQELITLLQDMTPDLLVPEEQQEVKQPGVGTAAAQPPYPLQPKYRKETMHPNTRQQVAEEMAFMQKEVLFQGDTPPGTTSDSSEGEEDEEEESEPALDATLETEDGDESRETLEHSPVVEYERKLAAKRREVAQLQQQRDKLMQTQRRLVELQGLIGDKQQQEQQEHMLSARREEREEGQFEEREEGQFEEREEGRREEEREEGRGEVMSSHLTSELEKQKQLYDELLRKTEQLRKLQTMLKREGKGAGLPQDGEVTPATWGGSTAPSETNSTISYDLNDTQESLEFRHTLGGSASVEHADTAGREGGDMQFTVTRHTPRHVPPRRVLMEPLPSTEKKMKLDTPATTVPGAAEPHHPTTSYSAVWPGVIFPSLPSRSKEHCRDEATQPRSQAHTLLSVAQKNAEGLAPLQDQHVTMLQQQLASTSNICGELLQGQNTLIHAICQRLDNLDLETTIQGHLEHLHLYQMELEQYHQELYQAYLKQQPATTASQSEQGEDPIANGGVGEGLETAKEPFKASSGAATATGVRGPADEHVLSAAGPHQPEEQPCQSFAEDQQHTFTHRLNPYATAFGFTPSRSSAATYSASQGQQPPPMDNSSFSFASRSGVIPPPPSCGPIFPPRSSFQTWQSPHRFPYYGRPSFHLGARYPYTSPSYRPYFPSPGYGWPFGPCADYTPQFSFQPAGATSRTGPAQYPRASFPVQTSTAMGVGSHEGGYSVGSPSASVQVQAPCSPPSAMSVNLQQHSTTSLTVQPHPQPGTAVYSANSTGSTLCVPTPSASGPTPIQSSVHPVRGQTQSSTGYTQPPLVGYPPTAMAAPATGLDLALSGHEATVAAGNTTSSAAAALLGVSMQYHDKQQDTDSLSSLPLSVPEETGPVHAGIAQLSAAAQQEASSVFSALRDTIYSEVATLIANNEARPHFLVELFRELQLLSTDYLRQRALYSLQDLVTTFISDEAVAQGTKYSWTGSASEKTPSESVVTSEDEAAPSKPPLPLHGSMGFDYVEAVHSGSSVSTPPESSLPDEPFASDSLGDTVIKVDKATAEMDETIAGPSLTIKPPVPVVSLGPGGHHESESSKSDLVQTSESDLDTQVLDEQIKSIMTEVIPVLKEHLHSECSADLLSHIRQYIMSLVLMQEKSPKQELVDVFAKQLDATLNTTLCKYLNKKLKNCGEDLLVDVSEVLFNELAFFRLMLDIKGHPDAQGQDFRSVTSGSQTTENEDEELSKASQEPTVQQPLPCTGSGAIVDEEEALGKSRDDELALAWDGHIEGTVNGEEYSGGASGNNASSQQKEGSQSIHDHADCSDPAVNGTTTIETPGLDCTEPPTPLLLTEEQVDTSASQTPATDSEPSSYHRDGDGDGSQLPDSINKVALQAQMKREQLSTDGLAGILASTDQSQELAGDGNELPETVTHEP